MILVYWWKVVKIKEEKNSMDYVFLLGILHASLLGNI